MIKNLDFKKQFTVLLFIPFLIIAILSSSKIIEQLNKYNDNKEIINITEFSIKINSVIHELQKERGASAGFLGSKGNKFSSILSSQKTNTDLKINELLDYLKYNNNNYTEEFNVNLNLENIRKKVLGFNIDVKNQVKYYSDINKELINVVSRYSTIPNNLNLQVRNCIVY